MALRLGKRIRPHRRVPRRLLSATNLQLHHLLAEAPASNLIICSPRRSATGTASRFVRTVDVLLLHRGRSASG
jgi:hypothetical protein